jgi:hypothetical protein
LFGAESSASREKGVWCPKFHSISLLALLEPLEFIGELVDDHSGRRIPPRVRREAIMKQVEAAQILDVDMESEIASPFSCGAKVQYNMAGVTELDFAPVSAHASA